MPTARTQEKGFTLVETLVAIGIFGIIMVGTTLLMRNIIQQARQQQLGLSNTDQARAVTARFVNELRNIAYGADGSYPLNQAGDTQMVFFSTYGGNGSILRIRYTLSGSTLVRGVTSPSGSPATYNVANEKTATVIQNIQNGSTPGFYYYDGTYAGTGSALAQPINVTMPKYAIMNLLVLKQDTPGSTATFTIQDGAAMRNLKTNLGN
jgi:prepilin-type N-terminal cleavage/methylation domain-containing protein